MAESEDTILDNALAPKKAASDGTSAEQHSITDQIAADRYKLAKEAARYGIGLKRTKLIPPGSD